MPKKNDSVIERTLVLIKPDGVQRAIAGELISRFERAGFKIVGLKMRWIDPNFAQKHYAAHLKKAFYKGLEAMITEGPVIAMVLQGLHAVSTVRKMVGATEPKEALPGTIRGDYAIHSYQYADEKGIAIKNLIHASGDAADAEKEIALWFAL